MLYLEKKYLMLYLEKKYLIFVLKASNNYNPSNSKIGFLLINVSGLW